MSEKQEGPGRDESVHSDNNGLRNQRYSKPTRKFTWTRDPLAKADPAASSGVTTPADRHSYRHGARESPRYGHGRVYSQNAYGAQGVPSYGYEIHSHSSPSSQAHYPHSSRDRYLSSYGSRDYYSHSHASRDYYPPSHGSRDYYPPSHGSRDYYPPSHGSRDYYPPSHGSRDYYSPSHSSSHHYSRQHVGASGRQSYGVRAAGHQSCSYGVGAGSHPSHGKGEHDFPSYEAATVVSSPKFHAVSLYGLPINCTEVDIIRFFDGLDIVEVFLVFINKVFSRKAFVIFANDVALGFALQRDKQKVGDSFVDILTCRRHDYYDAVAMAVNDGMDFGNPLVGKDNNVVDDMNYCEGPNGQAARFKDNTVVDSKLHRHPAVQPGNLSDKDQGKPARHILKLRCGFCSVEKKVILGVFGECNLSEDRVRNVFNPDGKPTGEMLLEFISEEDAKKAMSMDKTTIESYLIEIVPCPEELQITNTKRLERESQGTTKDSDDKELNQPGTHSHSKRRRYNDEEQKVYTQIIKLRNVPPSADMYDITDLFREFNLTLERLQVVCRRDGIATGEVYVEFDSVEDAKKAISIEKKKILSQRVELFPSSPNEASQAMSRSW